MTGTARDRDAPRGQRMRRVLRRGLLGGAAAIGLAVGLVLVLHAPITRLRLPLADTLEAPRPLIWGHRANGGRGALENSPEAMDIAASERFDGIELDVFYFPDADGLVVAHDDPRSQGARPGIPFADVRFPPNMQLWLDAKNLGELTGPELHAFARVLRDRGLSERSFIESTDMRALQRLSGEGLRTIHWLVGWSLELLPLLKFHYAMSGLEAVSVDYRLAHKVTPHFEGRGIFTFTVNAPGDIARLCGSDAIAVILTDLPNQRADCPD
jgi:glycerophosphoryl diester phosphodiesterase